MNRRLRIAQTLADLFVNCCLLKFLRFLKLCRINSKRCYIIILLFYFSVSILFYSLFIILFSTAKIQTFSDSDKIKRAEPPPGSPTLGEHISVHLVTGHLPTAFGNEPSAVCRWRLSLSQCLLYTPAGATYR